METPQMEPDGRTRIVYTPDAAAGVRAMQVAVEMAEAIRLLGSAPTFEWHPHPPPPSNERPWHKHTLPNRRRR